MFNIETVSISNMNEQAGWGWPACARAVSCSSSCQIAKKHVNGKTTKNRTGVNFNFKLIFLFYQKCVAYWIML